MGVMTGINQFAELVHRARSVYDIFRALKFMTSEYRFLAFAVFRLDDLEKAGIFSNSVISNWPSEFIQAYDELKLIETSPYIEHFRNNITSFVWTLDDLVKARPASMQETTRNLFGDFGYLRGVYFSVSDTKGSRTAVAFAGDREELTATELSELGLAATLAYNRLIALNAADERPRNLLSEREIEVIQWISQGKTSSEIGIILDLSEHTVNHHFTMACKKLNAVNRAHAISTAMRLGLIR